jgi:hypothetical protein
MSGPRTKARTRGGPLVIKLLHKVAHDSKEDHDVNIKNGIAHAVDPDQAEEEDQGE